MARPNFAWLAALCALVLSACQISPQVSVPMENVSVDGVGVDSLLYSDDRTRIEVVTTNIGGKNVFVPSTIVLTSGSGRQLSFFNTTDTPHGLKIPGLGIEEVLMPGAEQVVALPDLVAGNIYEVQCHLHPPHRGAALVVLPSQ